MDRKPRTQKIGHSCYALIDLYCDSYDAPPASITLDIDDTFDAAHGEQQLAFWNGVSAGCNLPKSGV